MASRLRLQLHVTSLDLYFSAVDRWPRPLPTSAALIKPPMAAILSRGCCERDSRRPSLPSWRPANHCGRGCTAAGSLMVRRLATAAAVAQWNGTWDVRVRAGKRAAPAKTYKPGLQGSSTTLSVLLKGERARLLPMRSRLMGWPCSDRLAGPRPFDARRPGPRRCQMSSSARLQAGRVERGDLLGPWEAWRPTQWPRDAAMSRRNLSPFVCNLGRP